MSELKVRARYPNLQTVFMVERFIEKYSGDFKKTELFEKLPKKMMWQTFQITMNYLQSINKILIEKNGKVCYIWNPRFYERIKNRRDIKI